MEEKDYIGQLYQKAKTDFGYNKDEDYFRDKMANDEQYRRDFHGKLVNDYGYKVTDYDEFVGKLGIAGSVVEEPTEQEPVAKAIDIMPDEEVPQQYRSVYSKLPQSLKQSLTPAMRKRGEMMATPEGRATWAAEMREASKSMPKQARRVMEQEADDIDAYDDGGLFDAKQMEAANATARNKSVYDDMMFTDADNAVIDKIENDNKSRNEAVKMQQRQVKKVDGMAVSLGLPTSYDNVADINTSVRTMFDQTEDGKDINKRIQDEMKVAQFEVMDALKNSEDEEVKEVASFYTDLDAIRTEGDEIERLSAELKEHKASLGKDATKDEVDAYNAEAKALKERFDAYNARAKRYQELEKSGAVGRFNELFDATIKNDTYLNGLYEEYDNKLNAMFGGWMEEKAMPMKREIAEESFNELSGEIQKQLDKAKGNRSFALHVGDPAMALREATMEDVSGPLEMAVQLSKKTDNLIKAYGKGNAVSLGKGFVDQFGDLDFASFGVTAVTSGLISKNILDKVGSDFSGVDKLTEDERLAYDALCQYYMALQLFQPNGWYKAGQVTAETIPFIFTLGASGSIGEGIGKALGNSSKAWVKTLAKAFPEAEGRVALSNIGRSAARITPKQFFTSSLPKAVARMATEGAVYAGTTGLPNTVATAIDYMMPELSVDVDIENRDIVATGMKERKDTWASALAKGFAMQAIEGSSEAFSTYALEPATKYLGGRIMASLGKNGERYFQNIARTTFGNSGIMGQASRHLSGHLFEYTEEMFGGFLRCISGLSDWDQEFNGKNLAETSFGLAPMEAVFLVMGGGNMAMHHRRMGQARTLLEQHSPESIGLYERLSGMSSYEGQDLLDREVISVMQQVEQMKAAGTFDETAQKALASRMNMALTMKEQLYMDEAAATMRDETMRYAYETYTSNLNEQSGNLVVADYTDKDGNTKSVFVIGERDGKTIVSDGKDTFVADGKVNVREEYTPDQLDDNIIESVGEQFNAGLPQVTPTVGETYAFVGGDMKIENVDEDGFITATVNGGQVELSRREFREMYGDSEKAMAYAQGVVEAQHGSGEGDARLLATSDNAADHAARGALVRQTRRNLARIVGERRMEELESMDDTQLARAYAEADGQTKTAMAMWMRFGGRYSDTYRKAMGQRGMNTILDFRQRLGVGRYGSGYVTVASYNGGLVVVNENDGQQATVTDLEGNKSIVDAKQLSDMQEADADSFASQATVGQRSAIASLEQAYDGLVFGSGEHKIASNEDGRGNTAVVVSENADGTITYATEFNIDQNTGEVHHEGRSEKTVTREAFRDMIESTAAEDMRKKMAQQQQEQKKEDIGELKDGQRITLLDGSRVRSGEYSQNAGRNFVRFDDGTVKMFNDMDELKQAIADASSPAMKANMLIEEYQAKFAEAKTSEAKAAVIQEYLDKIKSDDNVVVLMQSNMLEALKARGVEEEQLNNIADALHITQTTGQVFRGVFVPGVGVVINADGIASIDDTRSVYVHERQHGFTNNDLSLRKNNSLLAKVIAAAGRFELDSIVMRMSNSNFYLGKSHRTLADEFISHAMEIAYRSDDVESALREAGVTNEKLISIIKQLDDEQRNDQRLSQSRLTAPVNGTEQGDNRNDVEDSAGESGEVGGQGPRPAEGGDSQAPRDEVVEEQPEEEKKEEPQPQPKTREQLVAEEVSYVLQGNDKYLDNNLREARRKKKAADKRQPQSTDKKKYEQQKAQIKEQQDKAVETLAFWEDVKAAVDAAKSENQARLDEAEEALSQLDNALNPIVQVETTHKFDKEPANAEEAAAQFLVGFVPASSRINEDSLMQETGWSREEVKRFRPATTPNGGISVQQAGEALYAEYEGEGHEHGWFGDDADAKNVLINAMQETGGYGNLARYINDRRSQAEQDMAYALENALNNGAVQLGYENAQDMHDKRMEEARSLLETMKDGNGMLSEESLQQFKDKVNELGFIGQEERVNSEIPEELRPIEGEAPFSVAGTRFSVAGLVTNEQGEIDYDRVTNLAENITNDRAGVLRMGNEGTRLGGLSRIPQVYQGTSGVPAAAAEIIARASYQKIGGERSAEGRMAQTPQAVSFRADTRKAIESWAKDQGYWYDEPRLTDGYTEIEGGTESRVFVNADKTKVRKLTSYTAAYGDYMQRLMENVEIFNTAFPDAAYEVIGFGKDKNGNLAAVVEQPYIEGEKVADIFRGWDDQFGYISNAMSRLGFRPIGNDGTYTNGTAYASDINADNMVVDGEGNPHIIDAVMSLRPEQYSEPFVLYSVVTPQQDADYMDAVSRGDMETAQRMVMEAAKAAMPNTKVVDENGNPLVMYHGTPNAYFFGNAYTGAKPFTVFNEKERGKNTMAQDAKIGFFFTPDERFASYFRTRREYDPITRITKESGYSTSNLYAVFLNMRNPLDLRNLSNEDSEIVHSMLPKYAQQDFDVDDVKRMSRTKNGSKELQIYLARNIDAVKANGYDGVINYVEDDAKRKNVEYEAFSPSQIKSADPVTYDDQGNVIPLSQRFNESNDDIRYSVVSPESQAIFDKAKEIFGTTSNINEAGYILPDGAMLDFSGRRTLDEGTDDGFLRGRRTEDHRDIQQIEYEKDGDTPSGVNTDMPDFIRRGAIRIDSNAGVINLAVKPTQQQRWPIRRIVEANDGDVQVDFGDGWDSDHYVEYDGAKPSRVLADIDRYFDEGIKPEGNMMFSIVGQVINRNGDINYEKLDNIIRSQRNELAGLSRIPEEAVGRAVATPAIAAEAIARGVRQANLAEVWGEDRAREHTRELIKQWAKQSGYWYDEARLTDGATEGRGGTESRVFITNNGETVRKLTSPVFSKGDVEPYIESLHLFGNVFGESAYEIKGFGENEGGELCVVVEQPYIQGVRLSDSGITKSIDKIRDFMEGLGFKNVGVSMFENDKFRVEDVNRTNVIVDANGDFHVIDAYVSLADESLYKEEPRFSFIGRQGAQRLDMAERAMSRINDKTIAAQMEEQGMDAATIKMATGWERGKDGQWKYEIGDGSMKEAIGLSQSGMKLPEVWDQPELFKAYPKAKDIIVEIVNNPLDGTPGAMVINRYKDTQEGQKAIQAARLFFREHSTLEEYKKYLEEKIERYRKMAKEATDKYARQQFEDIAENLEKNGLMEAERTFNQMRANLDKANDVVDERIQLNLAYLASKDGLIHGDAKHDWGSETDTANSVLAHEIQHYIQHKEGFAQGGNPSFAKNLTDTLIHNAIIYKYYRDAEYVAEENGITDPDKIWEAIKKLYVDLGSDAEKIYSDEDARKQGLRLWMKPENYDIDRYRKAFETWLKGRSNGESFWSAPGIEQYRRLAGEVEARNVSRRMGMSKELRRATLAEDTEDVPRRKQHVTNREGTALYSITGRPMTMKEATTQELLKLAAENRDDARLQDDATRAATETLAELMLAMRNARKISKRRRGKMEGLVDDIAEAQARYDAEVADRVTNLATMLLRYGNLDNLSRGEVARLLAAVKNSMDGNIMEQAEKIVDVLLNHQLKQAAAILNKQLKTKASKVNESGVREQGSLDIEGQRILEAAREGISLDYDEYVKRLRDVQDKLTSPIETQRLNAELDYQGLMLAQQYRWKIAASEQQEKSLERELREQQEKIYDFTVEEKDGKKVYRKKLKPEYKGKLDAEHQATKDMVLQTEIEIGDSIRALQMDRAEAYNRLSSDFARVIARGKEAARAFREEQLQRIEEIHHNANSDLNGVPADEHFQPNRWWRFKGNAFFNFLFMPQQNFDEMLRFFAPDSADGKGYLFNRFMKMQQSARDSEWASLMADNQQLDSKVSEVFGGKMKWQDLYAIERKLPTIEVEFMDDGEMKPHTLTQGNALYIYMVNKMSDGAMKLRAMGITQEKVDEIAEQIKPRFIEIADWIQDEFLPKTRDRFNEVHMRLYGAPMAAIESYFPLKVLHEQAEELGKEDEIQMMSSTPGAIKERTRNINPLDVTRTDAFSLVVEHINEMEHWAAYAEMTRDLNTLLSYKRFRNRVNNMSSARFGKGKDLFANFKKTCEAVTGALKQKTGKADKAMLNIAKGVTASKINFRLYTAMKQIASMPAFWADADIAELAKGFFGFNPVAQAKAWKWAIEELPGFAKRWQSRFAGNEMLDENKSDWDLWRNSFIENASRIGMSPNAFVDAVTVAMGSMMVYESKLKKYKKQGYDDATAKDKALQDAWLVYNESQQSNDPAFLSIMQAERSWLGSALSLFRNASFGYGRRFYRSLANLKKLGPENRKAMIEYITKQGVRDGLTEEQAYNAAKKAANRLLAKSLWDAAVFGYVVQFAWNLMPMLPYLIGGDDDDKKKEMSEDVALHSLAGPVEGMPAGNIVSSVYNDMLQGGNWTDYDYHLMPLINDINSIRKKYGTDKVAAINDMMMILMGTFTGVDPRGLTDIGVAIWDACNGDPETSKEVAILIMRIAQIPQSQIDQLYLDEVGLTAGEARRLPADELAKRYAAYKMRKNAPLTSWAYDEEQEDKVLKRYEKKFYRMMDERIEAMSDEALETAFNESDDPTVRKTIGKRVAAEMGEKDTEGQTPSKSWLPETRQSAIAYQNERTYDDMKEDVALRHAIKDAEASGDTARKASLEEEKRELYNLRHQLNGDSEHDAPILREYRNGRSAVLRLYNINID